MNQAPVTQAKYVQIAGLMDFFPFLRKVPDFLLPVKREAKKLHQREITLFRDHYFETKRKLQNGTAKVCTPTKLPFPSDTHQKTTTAMRLRRPRQAPKRRILLRRPRRLHWGLPPASRLRDNSRCPRRLHPSNHHLPIRCQNSPRRDRPRLWRPATGS